MCPELLFEPALVQKYTKSRKIHEIVEKAISSSDPAIKPKLYSNIVLVGGSSQFAGLPERLQKEVEWLAKTPNPVRVTRPENAILTAWLGASNFASQMTDWTDWVNYEEFDQRGEEIITKKCF